MQLTALCKGMSLAMPERPRFTTCKWKKIIMRCNLIVLLILATCLQVSSKGLSQTVTCSGKQMVLNKVFSVIEKQTGYVFFFSHGLLKEAKPVTLEVKNMPLLRALDLCFKDQPFTYSIEDKTIFVSRKKEEPGYFLVPEAASSFMIIKWVVLDERGNPVPGALVRVKGGSLSATTDDTGAFSLNGVAPDAVLEISAVNIVATEVPVDNRSVFAVRVKSSIKDLDAYQVVSTGYQRLPKERATGSFVQVNNELINRSVSTNILERLDGVTSGLIFNKNLGNDATNQSAIAIRGRSTIYANPNPLIVVDNFPYDGDIGSINPNDVESITILKDAAAASIWGAFSGNGVIVITTTKGRLNKPATMSFNANVTVADKPDLFYEQLMSSADLVEVEKMLFTKGVYNNRIANAPGIITPAVDILDKARRNVITAAEATAQLEALKKVDSRNDMLKYVYRKSVKQQYAWNVAGGSDDHVYYFSAGFDKNLNNTVNDQYTRVTLNASNTYKLLKGRMDWTTGVAFARNDSRISSGLPEGAYRFPYTRLADDNGHAVVMPNGSVRVAYADTIGGGRLLDWNYRALDELNMVDNKVQLTDYRINTSLKYHILLTQKHNLAATVFYQYNKGLSNQKNYHSQETFFTRNLINKYTSLKNGIVRPVPLGGIMDEDRRDYQSQNGRAQLDYNYTSVSNLHAVTALAGWEIRDVTAFIATDRLYGYNKMFETGSRLNYRDQYPVIYSETRPEAIPDRLLRQGSTDRYLSYFMNGAYTYRQRYTLSVSARKDESNLFGVQTNQKGVPLWSAGLSWLINQESFYHVSWLPYLKLRVTNGYNGNIDKSITALITARMSGPSDLYNLLTADITNPPNPLLRWEKVHTQNIGVDFATRKHRIEGSIEYYFKTGTDLIGTSPVTPSTGITEFRGNTADMKGNGLDLVLNTINVKGPVQWRTNFLFSYVTDKITSYKAAQDVAGAYARAQIFNPLEGKPLYSVYSFRWAGLDPLTGDPMGYVDGKPSKDYVAMIIATDLNTLVYHGAATPRVFGSIRNAVSWKSVSLSFNITYKTGYYFRRSSFVNGNLTGVIPFVAHADYALRWQKPGDEKNTSVPSFVYPSLLSGRDNMYQAAEVLVEKGDHIRLQDIQLSYELDRQQLKKMPVQHIRFYVYASNLGILWKANNKGIDPDFISGVPNPRAIALGAAIDF
jgi:TonB-linked SusC/RagA family outer membrane protein